MRYDCFVFDLDGTLADTSPGVFEGVRRTLREMGEPALPEKELRRFIGPPLQASFRDVCGMEREMVLKATGIFRAYYREEGVFLNTVYPGMEVLLRELRGRDARLAVATLKLEPLARVLIERAGLGDCFETVIGSDTDGRRTKKDTIELAMERCGFFDPKTVLMIGDSDYDRIGAEEAGVAFCAATYGFGFTPEDLRERHPAMQISYPLELLERLKEE